MAARRIRRHAWLAITVIGLVGSLVTGIALAPWSPSPESRREWMGRPRATGPLHAIPLSTLAAEMTVHGPPAAEEVGSWLFDASQDSFTAGAFDAEGNMQWTHPRTR